MTSGNRSGAPIFTANDAAVAGLAGIADCFLLHNRNILTRVDDSVVRVMDPRETIQILRRSRGYVPAATPIFRELPPMLACGSGLKNTFCFTGKNEAFFSQHIGDLLTLESLDFYKESISHFMGLLQVSPVAVVCDEHLGYLSSHYAKDLNLLLCTVQHHHAHAAAVLVEHGITDKVLALILDGTGLGDDGSIWRRTASVINAWVRLGQCCFLAEMRLPGSSGVWGCQCSTV